MTAGVKGKWVKPGVSWGRAVCASAPWPQPAPAVWPPAARCTETPTPAHCHSHWHSHWHSTKQHTPPGGITATLTTIHGGTQGHIWVFSTRVLMLFLGFCYTRVCSETVLIFISWCLASTTFYLKKNVLGRVIIILIGWLSECLISCCGLCI